MPSPVAGNFMNNFISGNTIKFLNDEFLKFENEVKNDCSDTLDTKLPVRIIELFSKLFNMWRDIPKLQDTISEYLFHDVYTDLESYFDKDYDSDGNWEDIVTCECIEHDQSFDKFMRFVNSQVSAGADLYEAVRNELMFRKLIDVYGEWLDFKDGNVMCGVCNTKIRDWASLANHTKDPSHDNNMIVLNDNEDYTEGPKLEGDPYLCKLCNSEYSNLNSLIKHFNKTQHRNARKQCVSDESLRVQKFTETSCNELVKTVTETKTLTVSSSTGIKVTSKCAKSVITESVNPALTTSTNCAKSTNSTAKPANITTTKSTDFSKAKPANSATTKSTESTMAKTANSASKSTNPTTKSANSSTNSTTTSTNTTSTKPIISTSKSINTTNPTKTDSSRKFIVSKDSSCKHCQICNRDLPLLTVEAHIKDVNHLRMISIFEFNQNYAKLSIQGDKIHCVICGVFFNNINALTCHFMEERHIMACKETMELISTVLKPSPVTSKPTPAVPKTTPAASKSTPASNPVTTTIPSNSATSASNKPPSAKSSANSQTSASKLAADKPNNSKLYSSTMGSFDFNQLGDSDKKFFRQKDEVAGCLICRVHFHAAEDFMQHMISEQHIRNVVDIMRFENDIKMNENGALECEKCGEKFDSVSSISSHCTSHLKSDFKSKEANNTKKNDEKFVTEGKSEIAKPKETVKSKKSYEKPIAENKSEAAKPKEIVKSKKNEEKITAENKLEPAKPKKTLESEKSGKKSTSENKSEVVKPKETLKSEKNGKKSNSENKSEAAKSKETKSKRNEKFTSENKSVATKPNELQSKNDEINSEAPKPKEIFKLKKSDEKFISKGKSEKSSRCNLCDKELPTEATLISHTSSTNHMKNCTVYATNEPYLVSANTCSLCQHSCNDLSSLVKHFKTDTHQKTAAKGKKPKNHVHIPNHAKNLDTFSPQSITISPSSPKKSKIDKTPKRSLTLDHTSRDDLKLNDITSYETFQSKKPDNSYVVAKNDVFYCRLCNIDLAADIVLTHMNGATHRVNVDVFESCSSHVQTNATNVLCTTCKITYDHVHQIVKHFRELIHAKKDAVKAPVQVSDSVFGPIETKESDEQVMSPKRVKIPKGDRKHIFKLGGTIVRCNLCNAKLSNDDALQAHIRSPTHKKNSVVYQENEALIQQLDSVESVFECASCSFSGDLNKVLKHCKKKQHVSAKDFEDNVEENDNDSDVDTMISRFDLNCIIMKNGIIWCKICHKKFIGLTKMLAHMRNEEHRNAATVYKLHEQFIEPFDEQGFSYRCTICDVIFTRLDRMIRHFSEKGHEIANKSVCTKDDLINAATYDFECVLCSLTFCGFADLSKHCTSKQHLILKNSVQSNAQKIPYNIIITDYQYYCRACTIKLLNKALLEKHLNSRRHVEHEKIFKQECAGEVLEIVGYEYLCNLCWMPMYSEEELASHEETQIHKTSKNFDQVWQVNEEHLLMYNNLFKVRCKLCEKTIGIEKLIKHCTSRDHRSKFIKYYLDESKKDPYIIWKNASKYCSLCDCNLINDHNLANHVNSAGHKSKLARK